MPRYPGEKQQLDQPLYDTVQLAVSAVAQTVSFYLVPLGGLLVAGVPKTYTYTNLVQAGTLEKGSTFTVTAFSMEMRELAKAGIAPSLVDAQNITLGHLNFTLGGVSFRRDPSCHPPGAGAALYLNDTATVHVGRGVPAWQNRIHLAHPIQIDEQEAIQVDLTVEGAIVAVTDVTFWLWGTKLRPIR